MTHLNQSQQLCPGWTRKLASRIASLVHVSLTQVTSKANLWPPGGPNYHTSLLSIRLCPAFGPRLPRQPQPLGITCSTLSRGAHCQHAYAPPRSPPAKEHYLANSQPWVGFRSSSSTHNLQIPFLDDVYTRTFQFLTVLKSEIHCVIRNTFHSLLPLAFPQQRTQDAKCTHRHVSVDMAQRHAPVGRVHHAVGRPE